ncbi:MAG: ankyrin repeat domain-containing protein [Rickettsiaceae bacterium]|nr:ankyrin repeat domain-containing protein [Rickettsiaceae bacterium]
MLQSGQSDKVIKINDDAASDYRNIDIFKKNINFLSGYVLVKKYDKIRFSTSFLRSDNKDDLPGNLITFRNELKNLLGEDSFESIYEYEFKIDFSGNKKFETFEEGALHRKLPRLHEDSDVEEFFNKLKFVVSYPNQEQMNELLEHNIKEKLKILDGKAYGSLYRTNLEDWMADRVGTFYTPGRAVKFFKEIGDNLEPWTMDGLSLSYFAKAGTKYKFQEYDTISKFLEDEDKKVLDITFKDLLLGRIRVCQSFKGLQISNPTQIRPYIHKFGYIFLFSSDLSGEFYQQILNWFNDEEKGNLLVIECDTELDEQKILDISKRVINKKKVILLSKDGNVISEKFSQLLNNKYKPKVGSTTFYDLNSESQETLLKKGEVIFQGKEVVSLGELITQQDLKNNLQLGKAIEGKVLSNLVTNKKIEIGKALTDWKYDDVKDYYIPRKFYRHIRIKKDFKKEKSKFFVTYNDQINELDIQQNQDQDIVLVSDIEDNFKKLCDKYKKRNIHWLKEEQDDLIWQKSYGASLSKLLKFIDISSEPSKLTPKEITGFNDKIVIIAAEPGMGKSTVLTHLAVKTKEINPSSSWIVRVNLLDHSVVLSKWKESKTKIDEVEAVKFICRSAGFKFFEKKEQQNDEDRNQMIDKALSLIGIDEGKIHLKDSEEEIKNFNSLEVELFNHFYNQGKIALMFDGFDEISPGYNGKAIELLETLKSTGKVEKLLITTRRYPYVQSELEDKLNIFSYSIKDFSELDQKKFLKEFWEKKLKINGLDEKRFNLFTNELIKRFSESTGDREKKFMRIALHTMMIAEVFKDIFKRFYLCDSQELSNEDKQELSQKLNLATLYERFIEIKFKEIRFGEKKPGMNIYDPDLKENFIEKQRKELVENHKILALYTLFKVGELKKLFSQSEEVILEKVNTLVEEIKKAKEKNGIIDRISDDGKPVFVHRTFAEYFAAKKLSNLAVNLPELQDVRKKAIRDFLLKYIFNRENEVVRHFFDLMLAKDKNGENKYKIHNAVLGNNEEKVKELLEQDRSIINTPDRAGRTPLHLAAAYGYYGIVETLLENEHVDVSATDNIFGWRPLSYADKTNQWKIAELLLENRANGDDMFKAIESIKNGNKNTVLHIAAEEGFYKIAKVLLNSREDNLNDLIRIINTLDQEGNLPLCLAIENGHTNIIELLLKYVKDKEPSRLIEIINPDDIGEHGSPLFLAVENGNQEIVKILLEDIPNDQIVKIIGEARDSFYSYLVQLAASQDEKTGLLDSLREYIKNLDYDQQVGIFEELDWNDVDRDFIFYLAKNLKRDAFLKIYRSNAPEIEQHFQRDDRDSPHPDLYLIQALGEESSEEECLSYLYREDSSSSGERKKREISSKRCLFTWEDVDEFNEEKDEKRDFSKIKIDGERFVSYIKDLPEEKQSQLIQLASGVKVTGESQSLVNKLISNQKVMSHLSRVGRISGMTMHGMMAKNVLADFLNRDYQGVAINVGFIAGGQGFAKVAEAASIKGLKLASEGKLLLGRSLRAASPFLARGTSAFVVYDLVNQVKAFKNGTEEALVGVVGDSIYLGVDAAEIGVEVAEAFGVLEGVSSVTGPIGAAIGAVVFVGTDIYMAVKRVDKIDEIIHLTGKERFVEGLHAFIGMKPEPYIEDLMEKKQLYNQLVKQGLEYLKQHNDIQSYVFPTGKSVVDSCRKKVETEYAVNVQFELVIPYEVEREECQAKFEEDLDSKVLLDRKRTGIRWSRARPDDLNGGRVFCLPQGNDELAPDYGSYLCESAIGVTDLSANKTGGYTLINLGEGKDNVKGFTDSRNIFVVNNGSKEYYGGNKDDIFVLQAGYVKGYLSGEGGINTLDTTSFAFQEEPLNIRLDIGEIVDYSRDNWLRVCDINKVIGRKNRAETITVSCNGCNSNVKLIDGQSGNKEIKDKINIVDNHCSYQMQVIVRPNTVIYNRALEGNFDYLVPLNEGGSAEFIFIFGPERFNVNNTFWFGYEPVDIKSINVRYINIFNRTEHEVKFNFVESNKEFNVTISYSENPAYRLGKSGEIRIGNKGNLYMLESSDKSSEEVIRDYLPVANRVSKMSFFIQSVLSNETVVIGSGNHEVIHSNPAYRSHLVGNGGENVYVIDSETKEVIIHDVDEENSIDTIDLRNVVKKGNCELKVIRFENDLLLRATVKEQAEYCTVRLKDGVERYNKTHVILENVPMTISFDNNQWSLKPQPLMFERDKEVIVVTGQDVEEGNEITTPRKGGNYKFVRSNDNDLMITNAFDSSITKNDLCTITLSKFYETPRMKTLFIKFADKEIVLKDHEKEISTARDVNVVKKEHKDQVYDDVFNHTKSSPEVIMLSDQPVTHRHRHSRHTRHHRSTTSSSTRPTGWINDLFGWVKSSVSGLLSSKPESTKSPISQVDARVDVNGTIMLLDMLIRKFTGQKYISTVNQPISPLEAQGYTLNIIDEFEKVVKQTARDSNISIHRLNIDFVKIQEEVTGKIMSGKFNEISGILSSYVEKAFPGRGAGYPGKLSEKRFNEFMAKFNKGLDVTLNQSIEHNGDDTLEVNNIEEQQGPRSYLNNTSIQGHLTRNKVKLIS